VLALRALKLGDTLAAVPALRALARAFRGHERVLVADPWLAPIVDQTGFRVDPRGRHGADVAVNLHGRGPESTALLASTAPRRLVSFGLDGGPVWRPDEHEVTRWCRLLSESGIPADPADLRLARPPSVGLDGVTVLHPGASTGARRWPVDRWADVAARIDGPVVLTGDASEATLCFEISALAGLPDGAVVAGRTDLATLAAIVAHAGRVVCGDTGVAHLASAFATPSVVLFGPVPPSAWGPPAEGPHVAHWAGRTGDPLADAPDAGLLDLSVGQVLAALAR
jgi:ADP-heptose:LPS heptosyltransferase